MPVYLAHGFRWPRDGFTGIRVHAIVHNLEPVSAEYIQNRHSRQSLASSLRTLHPDIMKRLETSGRRIDFLEQYDPADESPNAVTQPYAFVCDRIAMIAGGERAEDHLNDLFQTQATNPPTSPNELTKTSSSNSSTSPDRATSPNQQRKPRAKTLPMSIEKPFTSPPNIRALSANVHDITHDNPIPPDAWDALAELRDHLAKDEQIGWWVVYNGDPERAFTPSPPSSDEEYDDEDSGEDTETGDSVDEGVKELRPKVNTSSMQPVSQPLPLHIKHPSTDEKESALPPIPSPVISKDRNTTPKPPPPTNTAAAIALAAASSPVPKPLRSPTGGRIPPPVPPPPPTKSSPKGSREKIPTMTVTSSPGGAGARDVNKELPLSPPGDKSAFIRGAVNDSVEKDPPRQAAKAEKEMGKGGLRRKFFGKKSPG